MYVKLGVKDSELTKRKSQLTYVKLIKLINCLKTSILHLSPSQHSRPHTQLYELDRIKKNVILFYK